MFGDIIKVTPTSKVVGDMALLMVSSAASAASRCSIRHTEVAFPESVVQLFRGELGQPLWRLPGGAAAQGAQGCGAARPARPGAALPPVDLGAERARIQQQLPRPVTDRGSRLAI